MVIKQGSFQSRPRKNEVTVVNAGNGNFHLDIGDMESRVFCNRHGLRSIRDIINTALIATGEVDDDVPTKNAWPMDGKP